MNGSLRVGEILGIKIVLHYSWFLIFAAVLLTLSKFYYPTYHLDWSEGTYWLVGSATAMLFFVSILLHELAHSLVAIRNGIPVKDITLFILGGVANIKKEADSPMTELAVAAAGPMMSILLAVVFVGIWYGSRQFNEHLSALSFYLATTNGMLALFNMIPGFPLDGGRLLRATLWRWTNNFQRSTFIASTSGRIVAYIFVLAGLGVAITGNLPNGVWLMVIGWFLHSAAESSYENSLASRLLKGVSVAEVMSWDCPVVEEDISLRQLVDDYASKYNMMAFPVVHGAFLVGMVTMDRVKRVPKENWEQMSVSAVMTGTQDLKTVRPSEDVDQALDEIGERDSDQIPVVDGGRVVGLLSKSRIRQFLKVKEQSTKD